MSKELLMDLQNECVELAAGGSDLAVGNYKLQKLLPKFEKLGQKIKPFKMVYDRINTLLNSEKDESEDNLIALTSLVNAILFTQAETDSEGKIEILPGTSMEINTELSNYLIAPVAKALTTTGGGRYNIVEEALKEEIFSEFRLISLLIKGLDDIYGEIAELIYNKLASVNNPTFLPILQESFNRQGKRGDALKLKLISKILGENIRDFCIDLLEDSSKEVKVEAVNILGDLEGTEEILLEQVRAKVKDVRKAAYVGLVKINSEEGRKELEKAIKKTDYDIVLEAIKLCDSENYSDVLLIGLKDVYAKLIKKQSEKAIDKIIEILNEIKKHRSQEVFEFLVQCLEEDKVEEWTIKGYYYKTVEINLVKCIAEYDNIPDKVRELIESRKERNKNRIFDLAFRISLKTRTADEIYDIYSPYFINKTINKDTVNKTICEFSQYLGYKPTNYRIGIDSWYRSLSQRDIEAMMKKPVHEEFDKRWIEIFKKYKAYYMLSYTLNKEDTSTVKFMIYKMQKYEELNKDTRGDFRDITDDLIDILIGLVKIKCEGAYEVILKYVKATTGYNFRFDKILLLIQYLPSTYIEEIEEYIVELRKKDTPVDNVYIKMRIKNIEEVLGILKK